MRHRDIPLSPGTTRWYDGWSRYLALLSFVLTLATTAIVLFTTSETLGGVKDLVATCIGLLGIVISLQLEMLFRVTERSELQARFGRLMAGVEAYPDLVPLADNLFDASFQTLNKAKLPEYKTEVFNVLSHANASLDELAQGRLRREGSDNTLVLKRFALTKSRLQGTTDEGDTSWWLADDGREFFRLNKQLIDDRNVRVERIWFLTAKPSKEILDLMKQHDDAGVHVFGLRADRRDLDRRLLVNLTITDSSFLQQDVPNKEGQAVEYLYSENRADIIRAESTFAQLRSKATKYDGPGAFKALFP
jgi:hypothetical protein